VAQTNTAQGESLDPSMKMEFRKRARQQHRLSTNCLEQLCGQLGIFEPHQALRALVIFCATFFRWTDAHAAFLGLLIAPTPLPARQIWGAALSSRASPHNVRAASRLGIIARQARQPDGH
jgi:hypothetical protein